MPYHTAVSPSLSSGECLPSHPQRKGDQWIHPACLPHMWSQVSSLSGLGLTILAHLGLKGSRFSGPGRVFRILPDLSVAELPWRGSCPWTDTGDSAGNQRLGLICLHFSVLRNQGQTTFPSARHRNPKVPLAIEFACFAIFILGYKMLQGWTYFKIIYIKLTSSSLHIPTFEGNFNINTKKRSKKSNLCLAAPTPFFRWCSFFFNTCIAATLPMPIETLVECNWI